MAAATIPVDLVEPGKRLREVSEAQVEALISSIADIGLLNPITVFERDLVRNGSTVKGYGVVAGAHRLEASKRLGLTEIEANIVALSDLERQIAECDENLCGSVLSKAERALFTKRRKDAYEALHPEVKHGGLRASRQLGDLNDADRFTSDTAIKTGQSERAVQRDAERGERVTGEVLHLVINTPLDTGTYLDKVKKLPVADQVAAVRKDLAAARDQQRSGMSRRFKVADEPLTDEEASEKQYAALVSAWNKAGEAARQKFREMIDTPVMDRRFG